MSGRKEKKTRGRNREGCMGKGRKRVMGEGGGNKHKEETWR